MHTYHHFPTLFKKEIFKLCEDAFDTRGDKISHTGPCKLISISQYYVTIEIKGKKIDVLPKFIQGIEITCESLIHLGFFKRQDDSFHKVVGPASTSMIVYKNCYSGWSISIDNNVLCIVKFLDQLEQLLCVVENKTPWN